MANMLANGCLSSCSLIQVNEASLSYKAALAIISIHGSGQLMNVSPLFRFLLALFWSHQLLVEDLIHFDAKGANMFSS